MEVKFKNRKFKVFWMYNSSELPILAKALGSGEDIQRKIASLPLKKQQEELVKIHPAITSSPIFNEKPDLTSCYIFEGDKIAGASLIKRHYKDPDNRDKARKYSLAKALIDAQFSREERKEFWIAYLNRSIPAKVTPVIPMVVV